MRISPQHNTQPLHRDKLQEVPLGKNYSIYESHINEENVNDIINEKSMEIPFYSPTPLIQRKPKEFFLRPSQFSEYNSSFISRGTMETFEMSSKIHKLLQRNNPSTNKRFIKEKINLNSSSKRNKIAHKYSTKLSSFTSYNSSGFI